MPRNSSPEPGEKSKSRDGQDEAIGLDELDAGAPCTEPKTDFSKKQSRMLNHGRPSQESDRSEASGLDELEAAPPDQEPEDNDNLRNGTSLEQKRAKEQDALQDAKPSQVLAQFYDHSHLIFFSILGVLARLGLTALTIYPGAPMATTVLWANVGGSLIMGFLREDRMLFRRHWHAAVEKTRALDRASSDNVDQSISVAHARYITSRSSIHSFIGMTVGFCGTFTSFADVVRDAFLALSNDLDTARVSNLVVTDAERSRNNAYSLAAVLGVIWIEVSMSLAALQLGAHIAIATQRFADAIPTTKRSLQPTFNVLAVVLGWGCWLGAILLSVFPPHNAWRGQVTFAIVFAPVGAMLRFHLSKLLNPRCKSFPLGTFAANIIGTCTLGLFFDLQHSGPGSARISCQVLQGVGDGFCGGLSTVSTWVLELKSLKLRHAYFYAFASLATGLACLVVIMGSLKWTNGFDSVTCVI